MQQENSRLFPIQFKSGDMSRDKVDEEQSPDDVASWKPRNSQVRTRQREKKKETFEITVFGFVDADVHLIQCTEENKHHCTCQTEDGQLERCEGF